MTKIWGLSFEEIPAPDGYVWWRLFIKNPFQLQDNRLRVGINEKLLREAVKTGVEKFIIQVGQRDVMMYVPTEKTLKKKVKNGEYELKKSLFEGSEPMRIFYFKIK